MLKKIKYLLVIIIAFCLIFLIFWKKDINLNKDDKQINIIENITFENEKAYVDEYYIYGTKLNISGSLNISTNNIKEIKLSLQNNDNNIINIPILTEKKDDKITFKISNEINNGFYLDNIEVGLYYFVISITEDEEKNYYLENKTKYDETNYYTLSNSNRKIVLSSNDNENMILNVTSNSDKNIYDIVIDPGHGGNDYGACYDSNCEKSIVLKLALKLKKELEDLGLKVKLTREVDKNLNKYDNGGRAVISQEVSAKYLLSIHLNSHANKVLNGVEIWTAHNINYDFAKSIVDSIVDITGTNYSNNLGNYKKLNGIYTRTFDESDLLEAKQDAIAGGYVPYSNINTKTTYYFMIRETGGFMTGAYLDGRDNKSGKNPYYNSNVGVEAYLVELGYIISNKDVNNILNNGEKYVEALVQAIKKELKV